MLKIVKSVLGWADNRTSEVVPLRESDWDAAKVPAKEGTSWRIAEVLVVVRTSTSPSTNICKIFRAIATGVGAHLDACLLPSHVPGIFTSVGPCQPIDCARGRSFTYREYCSGPNSPEYVAMFTPTVDC